MGVWETIPVGGLFSYEGNVVRKTSLNTFEDGLGIETQYQPILAGRVQLLGIKQKEPKKNPNAPPKPGEVDNREWLVDHQSRAMTKNPDFGKKVPKPAAKKKSAKKAKAE